MDLHPMATRTEGKVEMIYVRRIAITLALAAGVATAGPPTPQAWAAAASVPGMVTIGAPIEPDPAHAARYAEVYRIYRDAGAALTPFSHQLARRSTS